MTEYVLGFRFTKEPVTGRSMVALIRKNRPEHLAGNYNGVGGKIEPGETEVDAMVREFHEETAVQTTPEDWRNFGCLNHNGRVIYLFVSHGGWARLVPTTDEPPAWVFVDTLGSMPIQENLRWMIPLALDKDLPYGHIYDESTVPEEVPA
jgi:8-oxo-dGTP pyrophosphatase MutT (NUDIX family)